MSYLGAVYGMMGDHERAIDMLENAVEKYPLYRDALQNLGIAYYNVGKYHEALNCLYKCKTDKKITDLILLLNRYWIKYMAKTGKNQMHIKWPKKQVYAFTEVILAHKRKVLERLFQRTLSFHAHLLKRMHWQIKPYLLFFFLPG